MSLKVRGARTTDIPKIVDIVNSVYRGENSTQGWTTEAHMITGDRIRVDQVESMVSDPSHQVLVVESEDAGVLGCVHLKREDNYAYLGMLSVLGSQQTLGLGKTILAAAEEFVRTEWHCSMMKMWVLTARTELVQWYVRRGYTVTPERIPYSAVGEEAGQPLMANLEFAVLTKKFK